MVVQMLFQIQFYVSIHPHVPLKMDHSVVRFFLTSENVVTKIMCQNLVLHNRCFSHFEPFAPPIIEPLSAATFSRSLVFWKWVTHFFVEGLIYFSAQTLAQILLLGHTVNTRKKKFTTTKFKNGLATRNCLAEFAGISPTSIHLAWHRSSCRIAMTRHCDKARVP